MLSSALAYLSELTPIVLLLAVVWFVLARLPKLDLGHTPAFRKRRVLNWLPLGLAYAFLYMARYNLTVASQALCDIRSSDGASLMSNADFSAVFTVGTVTYGIAFVLNGPLTDRFGGRAAILVSAVGTLLANIAMAVVVHIATESPDAPFASDLIPIFMVLYGANMYFQSFGAVAIVKVNAPWFHIRERGVFGAIFGILISLGIYFAYDWGKIILETLGIRAVFLVPAGILAICVVAVAIWVRDTPDQAGFAGFDTGDVRDEGEALPIAHVFKRMLTNPIILTIALVEFCSGFLRQAIMQWYPKFAKQTNEALHLYDSVNVFDSFVAKNWGILLACAGILGGVVAGVISDRVFHSRRGPVAVLLYGFMLAGSVLMSLTYSIPWIIGPLVVLMSMAVIGVHGMLSGTASMDFGGRRNLGTAVGIIDGFVYLGTGAMSALYGFILPDNEASPVAAANPANWWAWPVSMIPLALIGTLLARRLWNASGARAGH